MADALTIFDQYVLDLIAAGWKPVTNWRIWKAPKGTLHIGPQGAWRVLQNSKRT